MFVILELPRDETKRSFMPELRTKTKERVLMGGLVLFFCLVLSAAFAAGNSTVAPTVSITSPQDGFATNQSTLTVTVSFKASANSTGKAQTSTGNVSLLILKINNNEVARFDNPPNIKEGNHTFSVDLSNYPESKAILQAFAYQGNINAGLVGESNIVNITIDRTPPVVSGTLNPLPNAQGWNNTNVTVHFEATDNLSGVTSVDPDVILTSEGKDQAVTGYAKDQAGNIGSQTVVVSIDKTAPVISLSPLNSPTNQNVNLSYSVSDNFTGSNEIIVTGDNSPYVNDGDYNVTLTAKDKADNSATSTVSFSIDKTPPLIIITSPSEGAIFEEPEVVLQGTVDGVAFSQTLTLTQEGSNTLTKTSTDSAGNTSSASVTIYYYPGKLIGIEGGEVSSSDGRTKLIIPEGALVEPTRIRVSPINKETLETATPADFSLLSAVECKPTNLLFNKPAEIIFTLDKAEIPGTPVELGLYDSLQNKIISTGQASVVPVDGYTLRFSLTHFSVYAALKSLAPQSVPIGQGIKIPQPDMFTGAFSHSIPITVPPGRKGMQPALSLTYRSSNSNSWTGLGFSLNPGFIVRSTRLGPPTYTDTQDNFYLITDSGTTELVYLIDNLYQAKIETGFAKFFKEPDDSWRVLGKDGSVLRFGQTTDAKEISSSGTFSWYLTKAVDTNGNYIQCNYTKDSGKSYLSRIDYTGNEQIGISPTNTIDFSLESRDDISSSYISSSKIATTKRLKEIQVKANSNLVWRYALEYTYSQDTNRSLLKSITQYGSDGKSLPIQIFSYQKAK